MKITNTPELSLVNITITQEEVKKLKEAFAKLNLPEPKDMSNTQFHIAQFFSKL